MQKLVLALAVVALLGGVSSVAHASAHVTLNPGNQNPAEHPQGGIPCDVLIRYDDGTDDTQDYGPTLGWYSDTDHQYLGARFTPPNDGSNHMVQSASFYADFWIIPGAVDITAQEFDNAANETVASVNVTGAGTWQVEFATPICIPSGKDFLILLCPRPGTWGVCGEDLSAPHDRSYWSFNSRCGPENVYTADLMIWSCVTECGVVSTTESSWGGIKTIYR
jgi:hypothetical protein